MSVIDRFIENIRDIITRLTNTSVETKKEYKSTVSPSLSTKQKTTTKARKK